MSVAQKKAGCGLALVALKRTGCDVWHMECQASNVTANVQSGTAGVEWVNAVVVLCRYC